MREGRRLSLARRGRGTTGVELVWVAFRSFNSALENRWRPVTVRGDGYRVLFLCGLAKAKKDRTCAPVAVEVVVGGGEVREFNGPEALPRGRTREEFERRAVALSATQGV